MTWGEFRDTLQAYRDAIRKAKDYLELNLAMDVKGNKKDIYRYIGSKRKPREDTGPHLNGAGNLETKAMEKARVFKAFLLHFTVLLICQIDHEPATCP